MAKRTGGPDRNENFCSKAFLQRGGVDSMQSIFLMIFRSFKNRLFFSPGIPLAKTFPREINAGR
jgi:hypothetical protein